MATPMSMGIEPTTSRAESTRAEIVEFASSFYLGLHIFYFYVLRVSTRIPVTPICTLELLSVHYLYSV